jgi:hypothetical protein
LPSTFNSSVAMLSLPYLPTLGTYQNTVTGF